MPEECTGNRTGLCVCVSALSSTIIAFLIHLPKTESSLATFQESECIFHCLEFLKHLCYRGHKIKAILAAACDKDAFCNFKGVLACSKTL